MIDVGVGVQKLMNIMRMLDMRGLLSSMLWGLIIAILEKSRQNKERRRSILYRLPNITIKLPGLTCTSLLLGLAKVSFYWLRVKENKHLLRLGSYWKETVIMYLLFSVRCNSLILMLVVVHIQYY